MANILDPYKALLGPELIDQLYQISSLLKNIKVLHINSTKLGGGVAEILGKMVPFMNACGLDTKWEIFEGDPLVFQCTKQFHNLLQGKNASMPGLSMLHAYEEANAKNAERLKPLLEESDIVFIHDPQPLGLLQHTTQRKGKWIWRCHVETSEPSRRAWQYLKKYISDYDATIFSLEDFTHALPHPIYLVTPSIDPLSEKNIELDDAEVTSVYNNFGIDNKRPTLLQVSRFDRFKDPIGVIEAFRLARKFHSNLQLVLAGGEATDDPEGEIILNEVKQVANGDPDIHILLLPADAHRAINALQRGATIILQKSLKEGFGLTVTEALWKAKPVIGGNTGGIRLQIINHHTGFLVNTPEGAAHRIRYLLQYPDIAKELGINGKRFVKEQFLITRHLREYLTLMTTLLFPKGDRINFVRSP
ncbi:MAG: glycosyltransferase [Chlamydiales bacterium]|nr:glycosyltransferase [Chlamydiales bacterium]